MGKANFAVLQDSHGRIQLYVKRDDICPGDDKSLYDIVWKKLLDIGDIIGVKGYAFITKTGETSVHVNELTLLSKSLRPLPIVKEADGQTFDAVTDPEFKYRQRYADLIINPAVKETFLKRTKLINSIREFLNNHGALEVDTPVLQSIPGGAGESSSSINHQTIIPDFTVENNNGELEVLLNGKNAPDLRISDSFKEMLTSYGKGAMKDKRQKEAVVFIKQKIDAAKWYY